jgi:hypothetical protein
MTRAATIAAVFLLAMAAAGSLPVRAQAALSGDWSLHEETGTPARIQVRFDTDQDSMSTSHIALADLGLPQQELDAPGHHATFAMTRDAGRILCDGWVGGGRGAGSFTFVPSATYQAELQRRGFAPLPPREQLSAAMLDLSLAFIDGIRETYPQIEFSKLIAFRALGVDAAYIKVMQGRLGPIDAEQMTSLRAVGVTTDYLDQMQQVGYRVTSAHEAVELKAVGVDADFVRKAEAHGFHDLSVQRLIQARALGVF